MCYLGLLANLPEDQELVEFIFLHNQKKTENTVEFFFENKFIKTISSIYIFFAFKKISGTIKVKTIVFWFY